MAFSRPLRWPVGWPRTTYPTAATFEASPTKTVNDLQNVLDYLDCQDPVITTNQETRLDGGLRTAGWATPIDTGVALYFVRNGKSICIPCDKFSTVYGNLRAIGLTLEYIKRMERYGTSQMVDAVFTGFAALPESIAMGAGRMRAWHEVLQVTPDADPDIIKAAYRRLSARYHPDNRETGDATRFAEVQKAYNEVKS